MKRIFNAIIVGAGRIGAFYDSPASKNILTHAHAFSGHSGFRLCGFVENDRAKADKAAKIWGVRAYGNIEEVLGQNDIDVVCVATPADSHYQIMKTLAKYDPLKLILLEKPITKTIKEVKEILGLYSKKGSVRVAVDYFRDYLPEISRIKADIGKGAYGKFVGGAGFFSRGVMVDSHMISLIQNLLGPIGECKIIDRQPGFSKGDPIISALLKLKRGGRFYLNGLDSKLPIMLEADLFFEKRRVRICDLGRKVEIYKVLPSPIFKGYENLIKVSEYTTSFDRYMHYVADNIYRHLLSKEKLKCSLADSFKTFEICDKLARGSRKQ